MMSANGHVLFLMVVFLHLFVAVQTLQGQQDDAPCPSGTYGDNCEEPCPQCSSGCEKATGRCYECTGMKFGDYCNKTCHTGCTEGCDQHNGQCHSCKKGYYGVYCARPCVAKCKDGCDQFSGTCVGCDLGFWGDKCNSPCPKNCRDNRCRPDDGTCWSCKTSYSGSRCMEACAKNCLQCYYSNQKKLKICYTCVKGFFGKECDKICPVNCKDNYCDKKTGECKTCNPGWYGETCENRCFENCLKCNDNTTCSSCANGFYGDNCEHECPDGCARCWRDGSQCYECSMRGYHPYLSMCKCNMHECDNPSMCMECKKRDWFRTKDDCCPCSLTHCTNSQETASSCGGNGLTNGNCSACQNGYKGRHCTEECSPHCKANPHRRCDQNNGTCLYGCAEGWYGSDCHVHCNKYYPHCTNCTTDRNNKVKCSDCKPGYYLYSDKECRKCPNCIDNKCDVTNGVCTIGCTKKYHMERFRLCTGTCENCLEETCYDNRTCTLGCKPGYYFHHCDLFCSYCHNNVCEPVDGNCTLGCVPGRYGSDCQSTCDTCLNQECDQTGRCKDGCPPEYHGHTCSERCSGCIDGACNHPFGCRNGCKPGYYGLYCNISCPDGCLACDQYTGHCLSCYDPMASQCKGTKELAWTLGEAQFVSSCADNLAGNYGPNCSFSCPSGCLWRDGGSHGFCDRYTSSCLYEGCNNGLFGIYCEKQCSAQCVNSTCDKGSGHCTNGCLPGWEGDTCDDKLYDGSSSLSLKNTLAAVLGPILGVLIIACIAIVCYRSRNSPTKEYIGTLTEDSDRKT